jgi:hypothetical protein
VRFIIYKNFLSSSTTKGDVQITPVNGDSNGDQVMSALSEIQQSSATKGSKLESALDRLGLQKRKVNFLRLFKYCSIVVAKFKSFTILPCNFWVF